MGGVDETTDGIDQESNRLALSRRRVLQAAAGTGVGAAIGLTGTGTAGATHADNYVYSGSVDDELHKISPNGSTEWEYHGHSDRVLGVTVDGDGYVYSGSLDEEVHKISPDGDLVWQYTSHSDTVFSVAVADDGYVYSGSFDEEVHKVSPDGDPVWQYHGHSDRVFHITIDTEGYVYSGSADDEVHKISPDGDPIWQYHGHSSGIRGVAVDADGYVYSGGSFDDEVHKISPDGDPVWQYHGHSGTVVAVAVDGDGYVYSGSADDEVHKISPDGDPVWQYTTHSIVYALAADADGYVYSGNRGNEVHKISPEGDPVWQYQDHSEAVYGVAVDNEYTAAFGFDGDVEDEDGPAEFTVDITDTNTPVEAGDTLEVTAEIDNTGDENDTQDVTLEINGEEQETQTLTLDSGQSQTLLFTWTATDRNGVGVRVASENDADNELASLTRADEETGEAAIDILDANTPVSEGETLEVDVELTNVGDAELTQEVNFDIDGQHEETRDVTVGAGESRVETFTWAVDDRASVGVRAASDDDWDNSILLLADTDFVHSGL